MAYLDHGTKEHNFIHQCKGLAKRIKQLTNNVDVHAVVDDWIEHIENYIMGGMDE